MNRKVRSVVALALLCAGALVSEAVSAQQIDFGKIDKFESLATGTLRVGAPPKTIVDDGERHVVILTIWRRCRDQGLLAIAGWKRPQNNDHPRQRHPDLSNRCRVQARSYRRTKSGSSIRIRSAWLKAIKTPLEHRLPITK